MNTPRVVMQETKKAFRAIDKRKDIEAAVSALSNLKGVGPAMASGTHRRAPGLAQNVKWEKIYFIFHRVCSALPPLCYITLTISVLYFLSRGGNSIRNWPTWSGSTPPELSRQSLGRPPESFQILRRPSRRSVGWKELALLLHQVVHGASRH